MKKILIFIFLFFCFFGNIYGYDIEQKSSIEDEKNIYYFDNNINTNKLLTDQDRQNLISNGYATTDGSLTEKGLDLANQSDGKIGQDAVKNIKNSISDNSTDLSKSSFMVDTSFVTVGNANVSGTGGELANNFFGKIIKNLMILLGIISLVVISIGGYFMVSYGGDDSLLTKGKNAIQGGIISLIVAISSYYIVNIVTYVLYS